MPQQGVRFLLAKQTGLSGTSDNESYLPFSCKTHTSSEPNDFGQLLQSWKVCFGVAAVLLCWPVVGAVITFSFQTNLFKLGPQQGLRCGAALEGIMPPPFKHCQRHNGSGIGYFDSFSTFRSKQKLQQALKSCSNFSLVLFSQGREKYRTTLKNPFNNFNISMEQLWQTM